METDEQIEKVIALIPDKGTYTSYINVNCDD